MTHGDDGFVAVGTERDESRTVNPLFGRTWISADGTAWELLPPDKTFDYAYLADVVATPDGSYLAFGYIEDAAGTRDEVPFAMWESSDGQRWGRIEPSLPADLLNVHVAEGAKGFLASAVSGASHQLWHSSDGRNWHLVLELPPITDAEYVDIQHIAAGDEGFVAGGIRESARYVMASGDGQAWFEGPSNPGLSLRFAAVGGDWVMTGWPPEVGSLPMQFSANGLDWQPAAGIDIPASEDFNQATGFASTGATVFVGIAGPDGHPGLMPTGIWSSADGMSWGEVEIASESYLAAAATSGTVEALAGNSAAGAVFYRRSAGD